MALEHIQDGEARQRERTVQVIIYLAGISNNVRYMKNKRLYEHVLFSRFRFSHRNLRVLSKKRRREIERSKHEDE